MMVSTIDGKRQYIPVKYIMQGYKRIFQILMLHSFVPGIEKSVLESSFWIIVEPIRLEILQKPSKLRILVVSRHYQMGG